MTTQNIHPLIISTTTITSLSEIEARKKEDQKQKQKTGVVDEGDSVKIAGAEKTMAGSGEMKRPTGKATTPHQTLKTSRAALEKTLKETLKEGVKVKGGKLSQESLSYQDLEGDKLEEVALQMLDLLDGELETGDAKTKGPRHVKLAALREKLVKAVDDYHAKALSVMSLQEGSVATPESQANVGGFENGEEYVMSPEEAQVFKKIESGIEKSFGIKVNPKEKDLEKLQTKLFDSFQKEFKTLKTKESELRTKIEELQVAAKKTTDPVGIKKLKEQAQVLLKEMQTLNLKKAELQKNFSEHNALIEHGLRLRTEKELGLAPKTPIAKTQSQSQALKVQSASSEADGQSAPALGVQSVSEQSSGSAKSASFLQTASAGGESDPMGSLGTADADAPMVQTADYTGVSLSIQSGQASLKADAKKTDDQLKKLLQACLSGNWEAVKAALILLDKRSSMSMIRIGTQAVKVQMDRQKFTSAVQKQLAKFTGKEDNYGAQVSLANAKLSESGLISQSINSLMQMAMSEKESSANFVKGVISKDSQIAQAVTRG